MIELSKQYNPKETEEKWYAFWEEKGFFHAQVDPAKKPFSIVIPPPNVTGILHMGHALNNTIQDILMRYHRMRQEMSLWMPGTDHAGIATQNVVEKAMVREGLKRQDLGREKFIERVWKWKEEYGSTIIHQLKRLGASCDWQRCRFTMDEYYSESVIEVFVRLYEKGLIYRGSYIINWCTRCQTALSDEEAPHQQLEGSLYYLKYPFLDNSQRFIVVATTRPETMLGDTAVAVNPKDKRYKRLIGKTLVLPLVNRKIKIIADIMVDMKFGTGAVKVTPNHDPNDYILGKKHGLEFINVIYPDGRMNENAGDYKDMDRFKAREAIVKDLKEQGLLEKIQPHLLSAAHCYRCHTIIEPYLSKQWFVKMRPLAKAAIAVVKKRKINFYPQRWRKVYLNWMENIQDWCISRQIWWGHRIPVYYCKKCQETGILRSKIKIQKSKIENGIIVSRTKPHKCPTCGSMDIYQDEDVLDTWFSSWLWPFATFGWPNQLSDKNNLKTESRKLKTDLEYFYPTSVLVTAPEIIFFWVARMIMAGLEFMQDIPFRDVYIHGTVRDIEGKKMSKSLGNIIDPLEIIEHLGADALRFSLISLTATGQDIFLSEDKFKNGRNFANKIWNASRFVLMNLQSDKVNLDLCIFLREKQVGFINRWILSRFYWTQREVNKMLDAYRFNESANLLHSFFWHEFCDWYLEMIKPDVDHPCNQVIMYKVLEKFLRLLHPFMPFITEEIWQKLPHQGDSIMTQSWPHVQLQLIDKKIEKEMLIILDIITTLRNLRQELEFSKDKYLNLIISTENKQKKELIESLSLPIKNLARLDNLKVQSKFIRIKSSITTVLKDLHLTIPFKGMLDAQREKEKIEQRMAKIIPEINTKKKTLNNKEFLKKAPSEIIDLEKLRLDELNDILKRLEVIRDGLG